MQVDILEYESRTEMLDALHRKINEEGWSLVGSIQINISLWYFATIVKY